VYGIERRSQTLNGRRKSKTEQGFFKRNKTEQLIFRLVLVCMEKNNIRYNSILNNSGRSLAYLTRGISDYHNGKIKEKEV